MKRLIALALILFLAGHICAPVCARPDSAQDDQKNSAKMAHQIPSWQENFCRSPDLIEAQQVEDRIPELKLDLPKLDKPKIEPPPIKHSPLQGSVQHQEIFKNEKQSGSLGTGNGTLDGNARRGAYDGNANKSTIKGRVKARDQNELGLGIIGVKFATGFGRIPLVYEVFPGTPAANAGMQVRDNIIAVDGIPTLGLSKDEVYNMIVGLPNTDVTISFRRKNDFQVRRMTRMDLNKIADPLLRRDYLRW